MRAMELALLLPLAVYAFVFLLHLVVPGRWVDGYVRNAETGKPLRYHLNGLRVFWRGTPSGMQ